MRAFHYLNFDGNAKAAIEFYQEVFDGKLEGEINYMYEAPGMELADSEKNRVMHASIVINEQFKIMVSDTVPSMGQQLQIGNNHYISLHPESKEEGARLFDKLSIDGQIEMPYEKTFWGAYFGSFSDQFGVKWMINYELGENEE